MKYLSVPELETYVSEFNCLESMESRLFGVVELFSLKLAGDDKQLYHSLNKSYESFALSPTNLSVSPFGPLTESSSRKILISLVTTLQHVYPCYDFSEVRASDFTKEPNFGVAFNYINSTIVPSFPKFSENNLQNSMWDVMQSYIHFEDCDIYRFSPSSDLDPLADALWSFHYFFYNKELKRVLFFSAGAKLKTEFDDDDEMMDDIDPYFDLEV